MGKALLLIVAIVLGIAATNKQNNFPDLSVKENLAWMGTGKIFEKDNTSIKKIILQEVKDIYIVYKKDGSLHDLAKDWIDRIEFPDSKWGALVLSFPENKNEF